MSKAYDEDDFTPRELLEMEIATFKRGGINKNKWLDVVMSEHSGLSTKARVTASALWVFMGGLQDGVDGTQSKVVAFPGEELLAQKTNQSVRTVTDAIRELELADFLMVREGGKRGTEHFSSRYQACWPGLVTKAPRPGRKRKPRPEAPEAVPSRQITTSQSANNDVTEAPQSANNDVPSRQQLPSNTTSNYITTRKKISNTTKTYPAGAAPQPREEAVIVFDETDREQIKSMKEIVANLR